jgi:HEXXH motif-containing protein
MSIDYHRLPAEHFGALATGGGGHEGVDLLCQSQYSKHVLLLHGIADASPTAAAAYDLLAGAQRKDATAAAAVVRYPAVGAWAYRTMLALRGGPRLPGAIPDGLAAVAAAAAMRAGLAAEIDVPAQEGVVMLPSLGAVEAPGASLATIRITADGTQVRASGVRVKIPPDYHEAVPDWHPLRQVLPGIVMDDIDPFRMPAAPRPVRVSDLSRWRSAFADAWTLLCENHPAAAAEVAAVVASVVPLAMPSHGHVSSSSPEVFGAVAMAEPPAPVDLALALTHEVQHMKLSAVLDLVELVRPDNGCRYYAPWREDPRPASGLLQGAYAFLGVAAFWRRQRRVAADPRSLAEVEFARWREAVAGACETLVGSGQLTADGELFVATMARTVRPWRDEPVPDHARRLAHAERERHLARWTARHDRVALSG